ncbi:MAG: hypothetical protein ABL903_08895 [Methylococcales bacterium]
MSLHPVTRLDQSAQWRFLHNYSQSVQVPEAILSEYTLRPPIMHNIHVPQAPLAQYQSAIGYEFSWGHILERRVNQFVLWEYCLSPLLSRYLQAGLRLEDCQKQVFSALERQFVCTSRDLMALLGVTEAWLLCPGSAVGAFIQVVHFTSEVQAKQWVVGELFGFLPGVIANAQQALIAKPKAG